MSAESLRHESDNSSSDDGDAPAPKKTGAAALIDMGDVMLNNPFQSFYEEQLMETTQTPTGLFSNLRSLIKKGRESLGGGGVNTESAAGDNLPTAPSSSSLMIAEQKSHDSAHQNTSKEKGPKDIFVFGGDDGMIKFDEAMAAGESIDGGDEEQQPPARKRKTVREVRYARDAHMSGRQILKRNEDIIDVLTMVNERMPWFGASSADKPAAAVDYYVGPSLARILQTEIEDFVAHVSPQPQEHAMRQYLLKRISDVVTRLWPQASIRVFGSFETQLYLPSSDLDIVVFCDINVRKGLNQLARALREGGLVHGGKVDVIPARVPIVKFVDAITEFSVDISFNQENGVRSAATTSSFLREYAALRPLTLILKQFLLMRGLNEVFSGGLGGYGLTSILVSFLQMHPKIQSGSIKQEENLGVLLMEFLEFYGKRFNQDYVGISLCKRGSYFDKSARGALGGDRMQGLTVEDPEDSSNDITRGSFNYRTVRKAFSHAFDVLSGAFYESHYRHEHEHEKEMRRSGDFRARITYRIYSILGTIVRIPDSIQVHREHVLQKYGELGSFVQESLKGFSLGADDDPPSRAASSGSKKKRGRGGDQDTEFVEASSSNSSSDESDSDDSNDDSESEAYSPSSNILLQLADEADEDPDAPVDPEKLSKKERKRLKKQAKVCVKQKRKRDKKNRAKKRKLEKAVAAVETSQRPAAKKSPPKPGKSKSKSKA